MRCATRGSAPPPTRSELITFRVVVGVPPYLAAATASEVKSPRPIESGPQPETPGHRASAEEIPAPPARVDSTPAVPAELDGVVRLSGIQVEAAGGELKVLLATGATTKHSTMVLANPFRLVVDLSSTIAGSAEMSSRDVGEAGVLRIRWAQFSCEPPVTRVVFDMSGKPEYAVDSTPEGPVVRVKVVP